MDWWTGDWWKADVRAGRPVTTTEPAATPEPAASGSTTPVGGDGTPLWGAAETVRRGWRASPELRQGAALTVVLAFIGAGGRLAVPILIQQAIDKGFVNGQVDIGQDPAAVHHRRRLHHDRLDRDAGRRRAAGRPGRGRALRPAHAGLRPHPSRSTIADHEEERRGILVARVTSDIETLSQFFSWGGIAWLLDGTMMIVIAVMMLVYDWLLALVAFVAAAPLFLLLRIVQRRLVHAYSEVRERNAELPDLGVRGGHWAPPVMRAYRLGRRTTAGDEAHRRPAHRDASIRAGTHRRASCSRRASSSRC